MTQEPELPALPEPFMDLSRALASVVYDAWADQMRAYATAAVLAERQWRPMETAPKKGILLGSVDGCVRLIAWGKTSHVPMYGWCFADQGAEDFDLCDPDGWMPPPAVKEG